MPAPAWLQRLIASFLPPKPKPRVPPKPPVVVVPKPGPKPPTTGTWTTGPPSVTITVTPPSPPPTLDAKAQYIALVNALRAHLDKPAVALDDPLNAMAQQWASDMATIHNLSHDRFPQRMAAVYPNVPSSENVASGWPDTPPYFKGAEFDVTAAFNAWVQSPGHLANLIGDWSITGIGWASAADGEMFYSAEYAKR